MVEPITLPNTPVVTCMTLMRPPRATHKPGHRRHAIPAERVLERRVPKFPKFLSPNSQIPQSPNSFSALFATIPRSFLLPPFAPNQANRKSECRALWGRPRYPSHRSKLNHLNHHALRTEQVCVKEIACAAYSSSRRRNHYEVRATTKDRYQANLSLPNLNRTEET